MVDKPPMETEASSPSAKPPRLRCADRQGEVLRPMKIDELIDESHLARTVWSFVEAMDFSPLYAQVKAVEGQPGRSATDAKILLGVWLYATLDGETSARRIARCCQESHPYIWLCGGVSVNYHTLSDFHTAHGQWLEARYVEHLASMLAQGLVELERVAQDGMRVRASAGAASFRRKPTLEACLEEAEAYWEQLCRDREENPHAVDQRKQAGQERAARERAERIAEAIRQLPEVEAKKKPKSVTKRGSRPPTRMRG